MQTGNGYLPPSVTESTHTAITITTVRSRALYIKTKVILATILLVAIMLTKLELEVQNRNVNYDPNSKLES